MSDLLLPATAALLDGWCGPVTVYASEETCVVDGCAWSLGGFWESLDAMGPMTLDLSRAECRDRVARHLTRDRDEPVPGPARLVWRGNTNDLHIGGVRVARSTDVPALLDLDPEDDTRLPDGSRVVDALALRFVAESFG